MKAVSIPIRFFDVRYDGSRYPGSARIGALNCGANCQHFAYELLRHFELQVPDFRSSELWADEIYTREVKTLKPLDLVLFNKTRAAYGAHVGVCVGNGLILHLCKEVGYPTIWNLAEFKKRSRYRTLVGAKRAKKQS